MQLSSDQVKHLARLARLDFSDDEITRLATELTVVLDYFQQLSTVDTTGVGFSDRAVARKSELRDDIVDESLAQQEALANAAERDDEFFLVPKVIQR